jgi:type IV secretion system protein TrbI
MQEPDPQQAAGGNMAPQLRLRPTAPPVVRLSRKVLTGLATVTIIAVSAALIWGLYQRRNQIAGPELYNTENKIPPDGLSALPRDYTGIPPSRPLPAGGVRPFIDVSVIEERRIG